MPYEPGLIPPRTRLHSRIADLGDRTVAECTGVLKSALDERATFTVRATVTGLEEPMSLLRQQQRCESLRYLRNSINKRPVDRVRSSGGNKLAILQKHGLKIPSMVIEMCNFKSRRYAQFRIRS